MIGDSPQLLNFVQQLIRTLQLDLDKKYAIRPGFAALFVALTSFIVYLTTMAHGVDFIDAGELTTDVYTLGICHPTGYPLFTLLGFVISHLPITSSIILRVNIMAAFFTAIGAGGVVLLMNEIGSHWMSWEVLKLKNRTQTAQKSRVGQTSSKSAKKKIDTIEVARSEASTLIAQQRTISFPTIAGLASGFAAAFSATWWAQSTSIEVYPLHLALVPLVLLSFLMMLRLDDPGNPKLTRHSTLFAVLLGLSFTNHLTTSFLAPATLVLYFLQYGFRKTSLQKIAWLALPFFLTLLLYLYLPIRSSMNPIMDWGHPTTLARMIKHIRGGQYSIFMFQGSAGDQWKYFWSRVPKEFTLLGFATMLIGIFGLLRLPGRNRIKLLAFTGFLFFGCVLLAMNYGIHDIDSYFLLAFLAMSIWIGCGVLYALHLNRNSFRGFSIGVGLLAVIACFELYSNHAEADESGNHFVDDYTANMLKNLPPNAIVFSTQWDFWLSGAYYYQLIEKLRPDVVVNDKAMLHDRPWYHQQMILRAPEVMKKSASEESAFMQKLNEFDAGGKFDTVGIGVTYTNFINALVTRNLDRPMFVTSEVLGDREDPFVPQLKRVADGIAWRLMPHDSDLVTPFPTIVWNDAQYRRRNYYTDNARWLQAAGLQATALRLAQSGHKSEAMQFIDLAIKFEPDHSPNATEDLSPRDLEFAQVTDTRFAQIEQTKMQIEQTSRSNQVNIPIGAK